METPSPLPPTQTEQRQPLRSRRSLHHRPPLPPSHHPATEAGYNAELQMVIDGENDEVADMFEAVEAVKGIKKPAVRKFKRELAKVRGKGETLEDYQALMTTRDY